MAKIDTTKIEGYSSMSAEEKIKALEEFETPEIDMSGYVKKETFDKTASELSSWKKKYTEKLTEEEKKKEEDADKVAQMEQELMELRKDKTIASYASKYLAQGYSEELANSTAVALADGDMGTVFANQQKFLEEYTKAVKAEQMKGTPRPAVGNGTDGTDYDKKIEDARAIGDYAAIAYYTRIREQERATK